MFVDGPPTQSPAQEAQHIQEDVLVQSERKTISDGYTQANLCENLKLFLPQ